MNEKTSNGCGAVACGFVGAGVGFIVLLFVAEYTIGAIYGNEYRDSSGVWGLSGLKDLIFVLAFSPIYLIAFLISYTRFIKSKGDIGLASIYAALIGVLISIIVISIAWGIMGQGKLLKPN